MSTTKIRKYGESVYVVYTHKQKIFKIYTGVRIEDRFWNKDTPKKNCPDYENCLFKIFAMQSRVMKASISVGINDIEPTAERVRHEFYAHSNKVSEPKSFWETYDKIISQRTFKPENKRTIETYKKHLERFCTWFGCNMDIETWDRLTYGRFVQYLIFEKKLEESVIRSLVRWLKTIMKVAYPLKNLSWMQYNIYLENEEIVSVSEEELKYLIDADLSGYLEETRDLFVFLATTDLRYEDSQLIYPNWVTKEEILNFKQLNTLGPIYPILYEAPRRVIAKYDGIPPQINILKFNEHLKELFEEMKISRPVTLQNSKSKMGNSTLYPLSEIVTSDTARKTFISLCLLHGMEIQEIMNFSGYNDYKCMRPYMKFCYQHLRNEAIRLDDVFGIH